MSTGVPGHSGVWALGDCAEVPKQSSSGNLRANGAECNPGRRVSGAKHRSGTSRARTETFAFQPIGELALVGRHAGVAKIYGQHFSGFLAWAMWSAIYLSKMPGMAQRARILLDWILDFAFGRNIVEFPVARKSGPWKQDCYRMRK